jgi:hypothetical protein
MGLALVLAAAAALSAPVEPLAGQLRAATCQGGQQAQRCSFTLLRADGPIVEGGRPIGDRINCTARFRLAKADQAWEIPHLPPLPKGGHSRTIMKCDWAAEL